MSAARFSWLALRSPGRGSGSGARGFGSPAARRWRLAVAGVRGSGFGIGLRPALWVSPIAGQCPGTANPEPRIPSRGKREPRAGELTTPEPRCDPIDNPQMLKPSHAGLILSGLVVVAGISVTLGFQSMAQKPTAKPAEKHLKNIKQLTHGGENAEAYFSADGSHLIFQSTRAGIPATRSTQSRPMARTSGGSAPARAGRRAATTIRVGSRFCMRRRMKRRRNARRVRATRADTSGRSTTVTTSTAPIPTAPASSH